MIRIARAEAGDLLGMCIAAGEGLRLTPSRRAYGLYQAQMVCSEAYAFFETADAPVPFAVAGAAYLPTDELEVWCIVRPGGLPSHLVLSIVRFARRMLGGKAATMCFVRSGNQEGARLARLVGFEPTGGAIGEFEQWGRGYGGCGQECHRRR